MIRVLLAGLIAIALMACQSSVKPQPFALVTPSPDYSDPSKPISVRTGETFTVALGANPALDFNWQIEKIDETYLTFVGRYHDPVFRGTGPAPTGFGGISQITFEAKAPGQTALVLVLKQGEKPASETATFDVTINPR